MRHTRHPRCVISCLAALVVLATAAAATAATITIVNVDGVGEGFNDPTAVAPVGGNPGTTIGQQRLNVFQYAASIWGNILPSTVTIRVRASFDPLSCSASSAVLGSAGTIGISRDFPGAPFAGTWYHVALANKLAGTDLDPANYDIQAFFNSNINGSAGCLSGRTWYYGYDGNEGTNVELLPVVLHELAHGLGFSTFADETTGQLLSGIPDIYARFMLDTTVGLHWNQMTDAQRLASAVNTQKVVWDGPAVTTMAPLLLGPRPRVRVNAPAAIAGSYGAGTAAFGPALTLTGVTAAVVLAADNTGTSSDACEPIQNNVAGKIALIDRGTCTFVSKALNAQTAGAIGVIIADNVTASAPPSLGGSDPSVVIPVVSVTLATGNTLKSQLANGENVTIGLDATLLAGADAQRHVFLYTPNPVQSGSSLSHWDSSALPDLLMEPALSTALSSGTDMTRYLFEDIGWLPRTTDVAGTSTRVQFWGGAPNPFTAATAVRFDLPRADNVDLTIYDVAGHLVRRVASGPFGPGSYSVAWDGHDAGGRPVPPGIYFSVLQSSAGRSTQRLVRLR